MRKMITGFVGGAIIGSVVAGGLGIALAKAPVPQAPATSVKAVAAVIDTPTAEPADPETSTPDPGNDTTVTPAPGNDTTVTPAPLPDHPKMPARKRPMPRRRASHPMRRDSQQAKHHAEGMHHPVFPPAQAAQPVAGAPWQQEMQSRSWCGGH